MLAEELERLLPVEPRDEQVAAASGDERRLEEGATLRELVADARREVEGPVGVATGCIPVPSGLVAP